MSDQIKQGFIVDGQVFATRAEAQAYLRRPQVEAALNALTSNNTDLTNFLIENQDDIEGAFEIGTIQRVTKSERAKLTKALEHAASLNDSKLAFLTDNAQALVDSFRWPKTARMDDAQKNAAILEQLTALANGNAQVAEYIVANKADIFEGYNAGVQKRTVNPAAASALAAYQARKKAEKEAAAAGNTPAGAEAPAAETVEA
jgi:FixJ family two-component response regulator